MKRGLSRERLDSRREIRWRVGTADFLVPRPAPAAQKLACEGPEFQSEEEALRLAADTQHLIVARIDEARRELAAGAPALGAKDGELSATGRRNDAIPPVSGRKTSGGDANAFPV